jgi:DNA repair protein RAD57
MSDLILIEKLKPPSTRVLQALENASLSTVDLLTLDVFEIHRRTQLSVIDVQNLVRDVIAALVDATEGGVKTAAERERDFAFLTTGDKAIDELFGGGIPSGALTEVTGERYPFPRRLVADCSGLGKSQLCLQLAIQVQLPRSLGGFGLGAVYIGTESALATTRLLEIATGLHTQLTNNPPPNVPAADIDAALLGLPNHGHRIFYINCPDLEAQEHIITYQLPVMLSRERIGLIILDSVTANYRAEFEIPNPSQGRGSQAAQMAQRSKDLRKLAGKLKDLAIEQNVAVLAVNQVTDNFRPSSQMGGSTPDDKSLLALDYQARWFDGSIDDSAAEAGQKKPALGLVWTNLITSRIMLVRDPDGKTRIRVVFSPFAKPASLGYEIRGSKGICAVEKGDAGVRCDDTMEEANLEQDFDVGFSDFNVEEEELSNTQ